jgi:hypothetical protein
MRFEYSETGERAYIKDNRSGDMVLETENDEGKKFLKNSIEIINFLKELDNLVNDYLQDVDYNDVDEYFDDLISELESLKERLKK